MIQNIVKKWVLAIFYVFRPKYQIGFLLNLNSSFEYKWQYSNCYPPLKHVYILINYTILKSGFLLTSACVLKLFILFPF